MLDKAMACVAITAAWIALVQLGLAAPGHAAPGTDPCAAVRAGAPQAPMLITPFGTEAAETSVLLRVRGVRYAIPASYLRPPFPSGCITEANNLTIAALLPNFEAYSFEKSRIIGRREDRIYIDLTSTEQEEDRPELQRKLMNNLFRLVAEGADRLGDHPLWEGLLATQDGFGRDVYFERDAEGNATFVLVCGQRRISSTFTWFAWLHYPGCEQHFPYGKAILGQHFNREYQGRWREIRAGTEHLLDGFGEAGAKTLVNGESNAVGKQ